MRALPVLAAVIAGAVSFLALTGGGRDVRAQIPIMPALERLAALGGFGVDEVVIAGHSFTPDTDIFDAVDLDNVHSFLSLDAGAVRARIERLPWVLAAELTREFPGRLNVRISERKPSAVWRRGDREFLIDQTGRVLSAVKAGSPIDLPRVAGEGAETVANALLSLLARFPDFARRLESAEWMAGRRWTLNLAGGVIVHLPADREALSLAALTSSGDLAALITGPARIIDLRAPGRVSVRPAPAVPASLSDGARGAKS